MCLIDLMVMFKINSHHLKQSNMLASKRVMAFFGWFLKARKVVFFCQNLASDSGSKIMVPFLVAVWDPVFFSIVDSTQIVSGEDG